MRLYTSGSMKSKFIIFLLLLLFSWWSASGLRDVAVAAAANVVYSSSFVGWLRATRAHRVWVQQYSDGNWSQTIL